MSSTARNKPYLRALLLGLISITSYVVLFTHSDQVMSYFVKGGIYAVLPIVTALYFSLIHGAFASTVLSVAGITAKGH